MNGLASEHRDKHLFCSKTWGPYFLSSNDEPTIRLEIIRKHTKTCTPSMEWVASHPIDHEFKIVTQKMCTNGFHPTEPACFTL